MNKAATGGKNRAREVKATRKYKIREFKNGKYLTEETLQAKLSQ